MNNNKTCKHNNNVPYTEFSHFVEPGHCYYPDRIAVPKLFDAKLSWKYKSSPIFLCFMPWGHFAPSFTFEK